MGVLSCNGTSVEFDDRTLAHLQIVIVLKFRRNECVLLSWVDAQETGGGRTSLWLTPNQPVLFHFFDSRAPTIDREWLTALQASADSGVGLVVKDTESRTVPGTARETHRSRG